MGLLFVRQTEIHFCSKDGNCRSFQRQEFSNDILSAVETTRPDGVVFLGELTPHPIEWLCRLRTQGQLDAARAAVIRSEEELGSSRGQTECWRHAFCRAVLEIHFQGELDLTVRAQADAPFHR